MEFTLIALTGPAGTGKDTAADILRTHLGFTAMAFADALRAEICAAFHIKPVVLTARSTKETPTGALALRNCRDDAFLRRMAELHQAPGGAGMGNDFLTAPRSARQIMQWWGTEYRRHQSPSYWVDTLVEQVRFLRRESMRTSASTVRLVVTDCRFANEAQALREHGALIWRMRRAGFEVPGGAHVSETEGLAITPDAEVDNSADLHALRELVLGLYAAQAWNCPGLRVRLPRDDAPGTANVSGHLRAQLAGGGALYSREHRVTALTTGEAA